MTFCPHDFSRGVLPVGGIMKKALAAVRAGIREIVLPALNEKDEVEIQDNVKEDIRFHLGQDIKKAIAPLLTKE